VSEEFRGRNSSFLQLAVRFDVGGGTPEIRYRNVHPSNPTRAWILHKGHVGALASARAHMPDMTREQKERLTWADCEKGKVFSVEGNFLSVVFSFSDSQGPLDAYRSRSILDHGIGSMNIKPPRWRSLRFADRKFAGFMKLSSPRWIRELRSARQRTLNDE